MDVIIWAIILGAIFYINKKSKSAGSKNTQPNKPRPQQKQMQQIWNSMQNTVKSGMNALNQTYQQKPQPQMQQRAQPQQSNPDIVQRAVKITHALRMIRHKKSLRLCTDIARHSRGWLRSTQETARHCIIKQPMVQRL